MQALACFTLRDIDFCKIESRPTSPQLFRFLQFQQRQFGGLNQRRPTGNSNSANGK